MTDSYKSRLGNAPEEGVKAPCIASTTTDITLSGLQTYSENDRVLVTGQTDATENGIYLVQSGGWERSSDFNKSDDLISGMLCPVDGGTVYSVQYTGSFSPGTTELTFLELMLFDRVAANITFTPSGDLIATDVQAAIDELDDEKASTTSMTSSLALKQNINYTPPGTGATSRTVESKLSEWISVTDFGAVGDGITDDSGAFTNAITAASGELILLPPGNYNVTGTFTGNFLSLGGVTITTGTVNYITEIAGDSITVAGTVVFGKGNDNSLDNIAIGKGALNDAGLASSLNIAIGTNALQNATTSGGGEDGSNVAVGRSAGQDMTTGYFNSLFGTTAGQSFTTAYNCTMIGRAAGAERAQGYDNVGIGREALYGEIGTLATLHTAHSCTAVGVSALHDLIDGDQNTAVGRSAGAALTSGNNNTFIGYSSGNLMTTGSGNIIFGEYGGNSGGLDIRTLSNQIVMSDGVGNIRFNIDGSGNLFMVKTSSGIGTAGHEFINTGQARHTVDGAPGMYINRLTDDGSLINFYQDSTLEGNITVSGTTVSLTGGHVARWSRFLDNSQPEIPKGTVLSNLDEMVIWEGEDNEQLNHTKISDVEGDKNVAGVFVSWDDDNGYNDFIMAMTGDMVIRIAAGVTVNRGDLLMSAGDGTAKVQDDDIVRSKTIAKVTSIEISAQYEDGSYAVPCVLMGC